MPETSPYVDLVGELVVDAVALFTTLERVRPETAAIEGVYHLTLDAHAGTVLLTKQLPDGRFVLLERLHADPADPATFGQSDLPPAPLMPNTTH